MSRLAIAVLGLVACGRTSFDAQHRRATNRNANQHDRQRDELLFKADGAPFQPVLAVVEMTQQALPTGGLLGLRPGERLYALPDGELALVPSTCIRSSSCGCEVSREYMYLRKPGGSVVVARLTPVVEVREVHTKGPCGIGCGHPVPPALQSAARLGVRQVSGIKFEEATYPYELLVETCDHPTPRP